MEMNAYIKDQCLDSFITAEVFDYNYEFNVDYYIGTDSLLDFSVAQTIQARIGLGTSTYMLSSSLEKIYNAYRNVKDTFVSAPFITNHDLDRIASMPGF